MRKARIEDERVRLVLADGEVDGWLPGTLRRSRNFETFYGRLRDSVDHLATLVEGEKIVALHVPRPADWGRDRFRLLALLDSIRDCASVDLSRLAHSAAPWNAARPDLLIARTSVARYVCSLADPLPPPGAVLESTPIRRDFTGFSYLWSDQDAATRLEAPEGPPEQALKTTLRKLRVYGIGRVMGHYHQMRVMWDDAHEANFGTTPSGQVITFDQDEHIRVLFRPLSPAQCATTLVPLLTSFSRADWPPFCDGYVGGWAEYEGPHEARPADVRRQEGRRVLDLIEYGDLRGWREALAVNEIDRAIGLLREQLQEDTFMDSGWRLRLWNRLGQSLVSADRYPEAADTFRLALGEAQGEPRRASVLTLNLAMAEIGSGNHVVARELLQSIVESDDIARDQPRVRAAAISGLAGLAGGAG